MDSAIRLSYNRLQVYTELIASLFATLEQRSGNELNMASSEGDQEGKWIFFKNSARRKLKICISVETTSFRSRLCFFSEQERFLRSFCKACRPLSLWSVKVWRRLRSSGLWFEKHFRKFPKKCTNNFYERCIFRCEKAWKFHDLAKEALSHYSRPYLTKRRWILFLKRPRCCFVWEEGHKEEQAAGDSIKLFRGQNLTRFFGVK